MVERFSRIAAIVGTDLRIRFRRFSTVVVFLLLAGSAYLWVPDPATGKALMQIGQQSVVYNSAAIGLGTAMLATMFIGLFGFYVISNAVKGDIVSRCGFVLASTRMSSGEYIAGKFVGNLLFLVTFVGGYMLTAMAMLLVRGEAPLEPLVFARQYLLIVPPALVFVSVLAITFESLPVLRGRIGDVVYFILWLTVLGAVASRSEDSTTPSLIHLFDVSGFGYVMHELREITGTTGVSIGRSNFDPAKGLFTFPGLTFHGTWAATRLGALFAPLPLLLIARLAFHRFDPARVKGRTDASTRGWLARINSLSKPLARLVPSLPAGNGTFFGSAAADARMTISATPSILLLIGLFAIAALVATPAKLRAGTLPFAFAAFAVVISEVSVRERRSGTLGLIQSVPHLRERFVLWKLTATLLLAIVFFAIPFAKLGMFAPRALLTASAGLLFVCALATALGAVSANGKTFIVGFLTFWYVVVNDRGKSPVFDFGGFYGDVPLSVIAVYLTIALIALAAASGFERWKRAA